MKATITPGVLSAEKVSFDGSSIALVTGSAVELDEDGSLLDIFADHQTTIGVDAREAGRIADALNSDDGAVVVAYEPWQVLA